MTDEHDEENPLPEDDDDRNHYEVLGIKRPRKASLLDIKKAYKKKAMKHHPDRVDPNKRQEATREFQKIRDAFEILSSIRSRALYDMDLESDNDKNRAKNDNTRRYYESESSQHGESSNHHRENNNRNERSRHDHSKHENSSHQHQRRRDNSNNHQTAPEDDVEATHAQHPAAGKNNNSYDDTNDNNAQTRRDNRRAKREADPNSAMEWNNIDDKDITRLGSDASCACRRNMTKVDIAKIAVLLVAVILLIVFVQR